jgi:hypothetical protein
VFHLLRRRLMHHRCHLFPTSARRYLLPVAPFSPNWSQIYDWHKTMIYSSRGETQSNIYSDRRHSQSSSSSVPSRSAPVSMSSYLLRPFSWSWTPRAVLGDCPSVFSTSVMHPRFKKYRKQVSTPVQSKSIETSWSKSVSSC